MGWEPKAQAIGKRARGEITVSVSSFRPSILKFSVSMAAPEEGGLKNVLLEFTRFGYANPELTADEAADYYSKMIKAKKRDDARKRNTEENEGEGEEDDEDDEGRGERNAPVKSQRMNHSTSVYIQSPLPLPLQLHIGFSSGMCAALDVCAEKWAGEIL